MTPPTITATAQPVPAKVPPLDMWLLFTCYGDKWMIQRAAYTKDPCVADARPGDAIAHITDQTTPSPDARDARDQIIAAARQVVGELEQKRDWMVNLPLDDPLTMAMSRYYKAVKASSLADERPHSDPRDARIQALREAILSARNPHNPDSTNATLREALAADDAAARKETA